jgi:hypothetical protein
MGTGKTTSDAMKTALAGGRSAAQYGCSRLDVEGLAHYLPLTGPLRLDWKGGGLICVSLVAGGVLGSSRFGPVQV